MSLLPCGKTTILSLARGALCSRSPPRDCAPLRVSRPRFCAERTLCAGSCALLCAGHRPARNAKAGESVSRCIHINRSNAQFAQESGFPWTSEIVQATCSAVQLRNCRGDRCGHEDPPAQVAGAVRSMLLCWMRAPTTQRAPQRRGGKVCSAAGRR